MTRFSEIWAVLAVLLLAGPLGAEALVSDAFGLYDESTSPSERRNWSGWRVGETSGAVYPRAADRLVIFAGPKSIVAGKDPGHVVAIVLDEHGNLVADNTQATVAVAGTFTYTKTKGGIADLLLSPRTQAEDLFVGVSVGERQSPKATVSVVADIASIRPQLTSDLPDAASDTVFEVASAPLADRYGNSVPEGTGALVLLRHADGSHSLAQGLALQNTAIARFIARDIHGPARAVMVLGARSSVPVELSIIAPIPVGLPALELVELPELGAFRVAVGPFLTSDGYALVDGSLVKITAELSSGAAVTDDAWVTDGEVSVLLPINDASAVTKLTILSPLGEMDLTSDWQSALARSASEAETGP